MKKPDPETAALLTRARAGEWLTLDETHQILGFNPNYQFRYFPNAYGKDDLSPEEAIQKSLHDKKPHWRMLGRFEVIPHIDEVLFMTVYPKDPKTGLFDWHVVSEFLDTLAHGSESTIREAARKGGQAFQLELFKREPVDPPASTRPGDPPLCETCYEPAKSFCKCCEHTFCGLTGSCDKLPYFMRGTCFYCHAPREYVARVPVKKAKPVTAKEQSRSKSRRSHSLKKGKSTLPQLVSPQVGTKPPDEEAPKADRGTEERETEPGKSLPENSTEDQERA